MGEIYFLSSWLFLASPGRGGSFYVTASEVAGLGLVGPGSAEITLAVVQGLPAQPPAVRLWGGCGIWGWGRDTRPSAC